MSKSPSFPNGLWQRLAVAGVIGCAAAFTATAAGAGECPAGQMGVDVTKPGAMANQGATDTVLASIDLGEQAVALPEHQFRLRRLEIQPGGEVAWHSHGDRPAIIYIVSGEITEYRSTCAVPIVHMAGEVAPEVKETAHWWRNTGSETVVLLSADILHDPSDRNM